MTFAVAAYHFLWVPIQQRAIWQLAANLLISHRSCRGLPVRFLHFFQQLPPHFIKICRPVVFTVSHGNECVIYIPEINM